MNYRHFLLFLLLLAAFHATAQEHSVPSSCRRGTPRTESYHALRRGAPDAQPKQTGGDFYHGDRHQLTVLAAFNDRSFKEDETATLAQWNKIFNVPNLSEEPFKGSVHDYFYEQSYGNFNLIFDLQYVTVKGNAAKYASNDYDDENSQYLVADIVEELLQRDIDWSLYDWNGDGFVNQLLIIYAGHGMNDSYGPDLIWPHQWWMSDHLKDAQKEVYCNPIPVSYAGREYKVDCYCALAELTRNNDYGSFGVICHEYTHCFGFPDFYSSSKSFVGNWELMDRGNYNGNGYCPAGYSAHERWLMGWLTPTELTTEATITDMPALSDVPQAYLVCNDGYKQEYYMVENRQKKGWDAQLPGSGVAIFHIDFDASLWVSTLVQPNQSDQQHYLIVPANNNNSTSTARYWTYPYNDNNQLTNTSAPAATLWNANTDGSKFMNKSLTDIGVTDGLASFSFSPVTTGIANTAVRTSSESTVLYRLGPIQIVRDAQGNVRKVMNQ